MAISWLRYTNLQNKTQCVDFFGQTYETKRTTDGSLLLRDLKKASRSVLFQKVCLGWKISPTINRQGDWNKNVLGGIRMSWRAHVY